MANKLQLHVLTNSERSTFDLCMAKWGFAYVDLLRPMSMAVPLRWGDLYHHGAEHGWLAAWASVDMSLDSRLNAALGAAPVAIGERAMQHIQEIEAAPIDADKKDLLCQETEDAAKVSSWSVAHYFTRARTDLSMVPLMIEGKYETKIPTASGVGGRLVSAGKIDLVLWDRELGRVVVQDHKGIGSDVHGIEKRVELDTQLVGYVCAVKAMLGLVREPKDLQHLLQTTQAAKLVAAAGWAELRGACVGAIAYNVVRRKMPSQPKLNLLKKGQAITLEQKALLAEQEADGNPRGEVSVAAIDTLPEVYARALEAQILDRSLPATDKQLAVVDALKAKGDTYFAQIEHFKDDAAIERWRKELWVVAKRMRLAERDASQRTRNPQACTLPASAPCAYSAVCLMPDDPGTRRGYRQATTKHEELNDGSNSFEPADETQGVEESWRS